MSDNCYAIIDRLVEERHLQGLTQKDLAEVAKLPQSVIARFERKKNAPQLDTLVKIANALKCDLAIVTRY